MPSDVVNCSDFEGKDCEYTPPVSKLKALRERKKLQGILAEWYGEDAPCNMVKFLPKARSAKEIIAGVLFKTVSPAVLQVMRIRQNWKFIAGEATAGRTFPMKIYQKALYLEVSHPAYIRFLDSSQVKNSLLQKVAESIGQNICNEIKFIPAGRRIYTKGKSQDTSDETR